MIFSPIASTLIGLLVLFGIFLAVMDVNFSIIIPFLALLVVAMIMLHWVTYALRGRA